jgi:hypothetical protein
MEQDDINWVTITDPNKTVLDQAKEIVDGERAEAYGPVEDNFTNIGAVWSVLLDIDQISPRMVARMLIAMKLVRDCHFSKDDNLIDICGYSYCASKLKK